MDIKSAPVDSGDTPSVAKTQLTDTSKKANILVVDHKPIMGRIIGRVLGRSNLGFAIATSGEGAVDLCKNNAFDLILMAARIPNGMSGMEATKNIRALGGGYKTIPIIAVATRMSDKDIKKYEAFGMKGILKKPVNEINLLNVISENLGIPFDKTVLYPPKDDDIYAVLDEDEMSLLNWDTLREYSTLMKSDYIPLLKNFLQVAPNLIGRAGEAVVDRDARTVLRLSHQLKSTSLIFGAEDLSNTAAQLEIMARSGDLTFANQYYKELHVLFEKVKPVLHKKLVLMHSMR